MTAHRQVYLRADVQVEPLIDQWYAWVHLIPPVTAAFNVVERHLKTMASYVAAPTLHAAAVANPAMRGGPFLDLDGARVDDLRALLERTRTLARAQTDFVEAIRALDRSLQQQAVGQSLEPLYAELPAPLRGRVELVYDRHHRPDFRVYEPLLYRSDLYDPRRQRVVLSTSTGDLDRAFVFATPRLADPRALELALPFASSVYDELFAARRLPCSLVDLQDRLELDGDEARTKLAGMVTTEAPAPRPPWRGPGVRVRYFGHACLLIETPTTAILVDPVISSRRDADLRRYCYDDLPETIDVVLITHGHHDHILLETLLQLRHKIERIIVPDSCAGMLQDPSLALMLEQLGFSDVRAVSPFTSIALDDGEIIALPFQGEHHDLLVAAKSTYLIRHRDESIMVAADSANLDPELSRMVRKLVGPVTMLFVGMECDGAPLAWVYGPMLSRRLAREHDHSRRGRGCNYAEALELVRCFDVEQVYVYAMGEEPWVRYLLDVVYTPESEPIRQSNALIETCRANGRWAERLFARREIGADNV